MCIKITLILFAEMGKLTAKQAMAIAFKKAAKVCPEKASQIYKKKRKMIRAKRTSKAGPPPAPPPLPSMSKHDPYFAKHGKHFPEHVYSNYDLVPGSGISFSGTSKQMKKAARSVGIRKVM